MVCLDVDLYASITYIIFTAALAEVCRFPLNRYLQDSLVKRCCLEFVSTFELCVICYELTFVSQSCGLFEYGVYLFISTMWWEYRWTVSASPFVLIENWLEGDLEICSVIAQMIFEILGGSIFYRFYLSYLWGLGYGDLHAEWLNQQECYSEIYVGLWAAALIEGASVFACRLVARMLINVNAYIALVANSLLGTVLVVVAFTSTGGYFSPVYASAAQYGCTGATVLEHLFVYWFANILGAVLAVLIWKIPAFRNMFIEKPKSD